MEDLVRQMLRRLGIDDEDASFRETPKRFAKVFEELVGVDETPPELKCFPLNTSTGMVFSSHLEAVSLCPHHLLPYLMEAHFAYLPTKEVVGISKPGRLFKYLCKRFTLQEKIGPEYVQYFTKYVQNEGCMIVIRGKHMCAVARGARQANSYTTTVAKSGKFEWDPRVESTFWEMVRMNEKE